MSAVPNSIPPGNKGRVGLLIAFACSGRLITPEMVVAMSLQPDPTHYTHATICIKGLPVDQAREKLAEQAIELGAKYLWFVDDDTVPPPNTARRLIYVLDNHPDIKAIGGVYCTKGEPAQPVIFRGMGSGSFWHWKVGDVFEVTGIGAGCLMINVDVFKKLEKPWFEFKQYYSTDPKQPSIYISEDISFCNKVRDAGYKIFAHGGVLCDHFDVNTGETYQLPTDSYPYSSKTEDLETVPTPELSQAIPKKEKIDG